MGGQIISRQYNIRWALEQGVVQVSSPASAATQTTLPMLAAGSYLGDTGIFDENTGDLLYVLQASAGASPR